MKSLRGKVAVVTGAASGIGLALAERFAAEGIKVVLADVEVEALSRAERSFETLKTACNLRCIGNLGYTGCDEPWLPMVGSDLAAADWP